MGSKSKRVSHSREVMEVELLGRDVTVQRERLDSRVMEVYLYLDGMRRLIDLGGNEIIFFMTLVMLFLRRADGRIGMTEDVRLKICATIKISEATYYRRMSACLKGGVLKRIGVSICMVDPRVATIVKPVKIISRETI